MTSAPRIDVSTSLREKASEPGSQELADLVKTIPSGVLFATTSDTGSAPAPDETWQLPGGTATVHYGTGHQGIQKPFLFADGFNHGPSNMPGLYAHLNASGFLDQARERGHDVILIGFDERHARIQKNAEAVQVAIMRAMAERLGDERMTVGGVSRGGIITRYALLKMEHQRMDHQTGTYISVDSPHNGAWIPLILQQLAYFFESLNPKAEPSQAALIRSDAAQQLLWARVPDSKYSGDVATASDLRREFVEELRRMGNFPRIPRLLGVANGTGDGIGRPLPPGEKAFDWQIGVASATSRFQPAKGSDPITWNVAPDAAVDNESPDRFQLDDFRCDTTNGTHGFVTEPLAAWILDRI
ncbi:MAG TPA: hypothetical protein VN408_27055 [Actinoplanes sp.]|nr:hypothetical protein [Actinoplanes sp.]